MTSLSIGPVRRWRRFAGLFAVLLVLAGIIPVYAAPVGVANSSFGTLPNCSLAGWATAGDGYVVTQQDFIYETESCIARLTVTNGLQEASIGDKNVFAERSGPIITSQYKYVALEQRFRVNISDLRYPNLMFYIKPESNNPGTSYMAQTIALYNNNGQLIYSKSRNTEGENDGYRFYYFSYDLTAYASQDVTLRITAQIDPAVPGSPTNSTLKIDFDCPYFRTASCANGNPGSELPGAW